MIHADAPANEAARIARLRSLGLLDTGAEDAFDAFTRLASSLCRMPIALVTLIDDERQWFKSAVGMPQGGQTSRNIAFCAHTITGDGIFEVEDARLDDRFDDNPLVRGGPQIAHYAGAPLVLPEGECVGTLCVIDSVPGKLDATQRETLKTLASGLVDVLLMRERERALERANKRAIAERTQLVDSILESLPCGLMVFDSELRHVASNPTARKMFDLPDEIFEGTNVPFETICLYAARNGAYGDVDPEAFVAARIARMRRRVASQTQRETRNGRVLDVRGAYTPDGTLVATYLDITEEVRKARELNVSQQRHARAIEVVGLGLWEWDVRTDTVYLSEGWAKMLELPVRESHGPAFTMLQHVPPEGRRELVSERKRLLRGDIERLAVSHEAVTYTGKTRWFQTIASVTERDAQGRAVMVVGACKDITHQRQVETALMEAKAAADEANLAKSEFLATMSHEIRTPINGVIGLTRLLSGSDLPERESGYVKLVDSCAKSLLGLVDNILDFSQIEAGRMVLDESSLDLRQLCRDVADLFSVRSQEKGLAFDFAMDASLPRWIRTDGGRLRQVLMNLLGNAWKFTADGLIAFDVRRVGDAADPSVAFTVSDTGIGISHEDQARLFTRFTQADGSATRKHDGSGLGLAISRQLAGLMGGNVALQSSPGRGSTFTFTMPLREASAWIDAPEAQAGASESQPASLLLVEDNDINQLVACGILEALGFDNVATAMNGLEALDACAKQDFDLVLMDCQMPEMDGLQATRELRARGFAMPIIALTANAIAGDRERCLAAGMQDYLTKPIEPSVLADKLQRWLGVAGVATGPAPLMNFEAEPAAFDRAGVRERFMGNDVLIRQAREIFLERTLMSLGELQLLTSRGEDDAARRLAHGLKGSAGTIGAERLARLCRKVESGEAPATPEWLQKAQEALAAYAQESAVA